MTESTTTKLLLILPGSLRIKKNSRKPITIGGKTCKRKTIMVAGKPYRAWEVDARAAAMRQLPPRFQLIRGAIEVRATVYYRGNRPDLSGALESIGDCLQGIVYEDDRQIESWDGSRVIHDLDNPRAEVEIREGE